MIFADPLDNNSDDERGNRAKWYYSPLSISVRKEKYSFEDGSSLRTALEMGEWASDGISMDAWRCLWSGAPTEIRLKALELDLAPPSDDSCDWFSERYRREKALKAVFLPESKKDANGEWQAVISPEREKLADLLSEKYPALMQLWFKDALSNLKMNPEKFWSSPWALVARPEMLTDCKRMVKHDAYGFFIENSDLFSKADYLSLGLGREMPVMIEDALKKGASPNDYVLNRRNEKQTVFQTLIYRSDYESVEKMIAMHGAELEQRDQRGLTPFLSAVITHDFEMMDLLKEKGANIHAVDRFGQNAVLLILDKIKVGKRTSSGYKYDPGWKLEVDEKEKLLETLLKVQSVLTKLNEYGIDKDLKAKGYKKSKKNPDVFYEGIGSARRGRYTATDGNGWGDIVDKVIQELKVSANAEQQVQLVENWKTDLHVNWTVRKLMNVKPEKDLENTNVKLNIGGFSRF